uniref:CUB domain-containing protein n=1 Tax=Branchiostoma floridae TaxID=7739 RepID=C3ZK03_BRAFL|eukprot:XP_002591090.1 hypothetical protein BRAFLDRAFT_108699 [Branchiostoma floridae]
MARETSCGYVRCGIPDQYRCGLIYSPGYPHAFPSSAICLWTIEGPPGSYVTLVLLDVDLPCASRVLQVRDRFLTVGWNTIHGLCRGEAEQKRYVSSSDEMRLVMLATSHIADFGASRGFMATFNVSTFSASRQVTHGCKNLVPSAGRRQDELLRCHSDEERLGNGPMIDVTGDAFELINMEKAVTEACEADPICKAGIPGDMQYSLVQHFNSVGVVGCGDTVDVTFTVIWAGENGGKTEKHEITCPGPKPAVHAISDSLKHVAELGGKLGRIRLVPEVGSKFRGEPNVGVPARSLDGGVFKICFYGDDGKHKAAQMVSAHTEEELLTKQRCAVYVKDARKDCMAAAYGLKKEEKAGVDAVPLMVDVLSGETLLRALYRDARFDRAVVNRFVATKVDEPDSGNHLMSTGADLHSSTLVLKLVDEEEVTDEDAERARDYEGSLCPLPKAQRKDPEAGAPAPLEQAHVEFHHYTGELQPMRYSRFTFKAEPVHEDADTDFCILELQPSEVASDSAVDICSRATTCWRLSARWFDAKGRLTVMSKGTRPMYKNSVTTVMQYVSMTSVRTQLYGLAETGALQENLVKDMFPSV